MKLQIGCYKIKMMKTLYCFFTFFFVFVSLGCDGIICKGEKKSVVFNYYPEFQVVDVVGSPTYNKNSLKAGWVSKLIVSRKGFLVLTKQKTVDKNVKTEKQNCKEAITTYTHDGKEQKYCMVFVYDLQTYSKKEGYKYWYRLTDQERLLLTDINSRLSRKPDFQALKCSYSPIGGLLDFIITASRV